MSQTKYPEPEDGSAKLNETNVFGPFARDPVIEAYKQHVDRTILRENLKLSHQQRSEKFLSFMRGVLQMSEAAEQSRRRR